MTHRKVLIAVLPRGWWRRRGSEVERGRRRSPARPTSSAGGPCSTSRRTASASSPSSAGRVSHRASSAAAHGDPVVPSSLRQPVSASRSISTAARWSSSSCQAPLGVHGRPELQHRAEVVGQLAGRLVPLDAGRAVGLLELHQRHAAAAGVAVGEVGEVERALAGVVEGGDVVLLQHAEVACHAGGRAAARGACCRATSASSSSTRGDAAPPWGSRAAPSSAAQTGRTASGRASRAAEARTSVAPSRVAGRGRPGAPLPSQLSRLTPRGLVARRGERVGGLPVLEHPEVLDRDGRRVARTPRRTGPAGRRPGRPPGSRWPAPRARAPARRARWDDVALVVLGDREQPEHVVHLLPRHPDARRDRVVRVATEVDVAHVGAHRGELLQDPGRRARGRRR